MAIRPVAFNADGSIQMWHDERRHGGAILVSQISFEKYPDGSPDRRFCLVPCPFVECESVSLHPVSGGCAPEEVQLLFVYLLHRKDGLPLARALEEARAMSDLMDGEGHWLYAVVDQLDRLPPEKDPPAVPPIVEDDSGGIDALSPTAVLRLRSSLMPKG